MEELFRIIFSPQAVARVEQLRRKVEEAFNQEEPPYTKESYRRIRASLWPQDVEGAASDMREGEFFSIYYRKLVPEVRAILEEHTAHVDRATREKAVASATSYVQQTIPPFVRDGIFSISEDIPDSILSLDKLTGLFKNQMDLLPRQQQAIIFALIQGTANKPLGSFFTQHDLQGLPYKIDIPQTSLPSLLERLTDKAILLRKKMTDVKSCYRFRNPAFELWARVRFLSERQFSLSAEAVTAICPVLRVADQLDPASFVTVFCQQAAIPSLTGRRKEEALTLP